MFRYRSALAYLMMTDAPHPSHGSRKKTKPGFEKKAYASVTGGGHAPFIVVRCHSFVVFTTGDPCDIGNLVRIGAHHSRGLKHEDMNEFPTRQFGRFLARDPQRLGANDAHLLLDLANGSLVVIFPGTDMATDRDIPPSGEMVLAGAPLLEQHAAHAIMQDHMDGAVQQHLRVNLPPSRQTHHAILLIHDRK